MVARPRELERFVLPVDRMVTVYVWKFRGKNVAWGHAAVRVQQTHMSWWPEDGHRISSFPNAQRLPLVGSALGKVYSAHPFRDQRLADDIRFEEQQPPDKQIDCTGLDENAMLDWWESFGLTRNGVVLQGPLPAWHTTRLNCSTVVATALKKGGGDHYAPGVASWNLVWKPTDVLQYALAIAQGLARTGVHGGARD